MASDNLGTKNLDELVTASLLDIVRDKAERLIDEGIITDLKDGKKY